MAAAGRMWRWLQLLLLLLCGCGQGARLVMLPMPVPSHCFEMAGVARSLLARGHHVTFYLPDYFRHQSCVGPDLKAEVIRYPTAPGLGEQLRKQHEDFTKDIFDGYMGVASMVPFMREYGTGICRGLLASGLEKLRGKFDMAVVDSFPFTRCHALVPAFLDIPMVVEGSTIDPFDSFAPFPGAFKPAPVLQDEVDLETFLGRLQNTLAFLGMRFLPFFTSDLADRRQFGLGERFEALSEKQCFKEAALYLENSDVAFDPPGPTFPNHILIGAITARPPRAVGGELQKFLDGAKDGVVVVSFGSHINYAPQALMDALLGGLKRLRAKVLLKSNQDGEDGNVRMVTWLPQNDVLGHGNTRLFISHCGKNSVMEALFHGVPVMGVPLFADNFYNVARLVAKGVGARLDWKTATAEKVHGTAASVLSDPGYRERMGNLSRMLRDRVDTPGERAARAIEHVLQHGSSHLRPSVAPRLYVFQALLLDVWLFLLALLLLLLSLLVFLARRVCCRRRREKGGRPKTD